MLRLALLFPSVRKRLAEERRLAFEAELNARLERRKASRALRTERARRGAATKVHTQVNRDPLLHEQVEF